MSLVSLKIANIDFVPVFHPHFIVSHKSEPQIEYIHNTQCLLGIQHIWARAYFRAVDSHDLVRVSSRTCVETSKYAQNGLKFFFSAHLSYRKLKVFKIAEHLKLEIKHTGILILWLLYISKKTVSFVICFLFRIIMADIYFNLMSKL